MLQKNSFGFAPFRPVYFSLTAFITAITLMGARCESSGTDRRTAVTLADTVPYNLSSPNQKIVLEEDALREISGIGFTAISGILAAVADEKGEVFMLDLNNNGQIADRILFKEKGDFEGVEIVGDTIYAIKSDAKLYEIINWKNNPAPVVNIYENPLTEENDIEGLCYDAQKHSLLISCKENPDLNTTRNIWSFDIKTKKLSDKPAFAIDPDKIDQAVPLDEEDKNRHFSTSGIAIHPQTGDLYAVSSALKRLIVLDGKTGALKSAARIDRQLLVQPEGIAFDNAGNLYISSEGKKQQGYILKFEKSKER